MAVGLGSLYGQNLLKDPSFENTKSRDRWGLVFSDWGGNIYEGASRFEVGTISHAGKTSGLIVGDIGGKIRFSSGSMKLEPGRYRLTAWLRGLDIGQGRWGTTIDFTADAEQYFSFRKNGTFGWTPLTYVFDVTPQSRPFQLLIGLWEDGRLWVDDVALGKVGQTVALTARPEFGMEEAPIVPPGKIVNPIHCAACGYLNDAAWKTCYACGADVLTQTRRVFTSPAVQVFADFENGTTQPFAGGEVDREHPSHGRAALKLTKGYASMDAPQDWSQHDYVVFDAFNPQDKPVILDLEVRDQETRDYWTRVNLNTMVAPGQSTVTIPTALYVGEKSRPGRLLIRNKVTRFVVGVGDNGPVIFDNFRLERLNTDEVVFEGLYAFDFGPADGPLMEGFRRAGATPPYSPGRGYGWVNATFWRSFNVLQPEALTQDFVCPESGAFRIDVPNGKYHVTMILDSPNGFWGEVQLYRTREVQANGKTVVSDTLDLDSFKARYFRNAHREDLPGINTFDEYVQKMFGPKQFDVDVTDGKLELSFKGQNWANCLSALVVYPDAKRAEGERFLSWVTDRRRKQFDDYFKQMPVSREGAGPPRSGFVLFRRHVMDPANAYDGPRAAELIGADGLSVSAALGEEAALTFALQPADDPGTMRIDISPLTSPNGTALPASALVPGWLDYRITRITMDGSVYSVRPRYWHPTPAPGGEGVTRNFWVRVRIPEDAQPGTYAGTLTVQAQGRVPARVPLTIRLLPFKLAPITDVAVGPWGSGIGLPWYGDDPAVRAWNWSMFEKALDVLREAGCTSFSGRPSSLAVSAANGRVALNTTVADREMALIRQKGFDKVISSYGAGGIGLYPLYDGIDDVRAKAAGFADADALLKAGWKAVDDHAVANNWVPVAWNLCDEPVGDAIPPIVKNCLAHRRAAQGLKLTNFMGATSMTGNDANDPHYDLVRALPMPSLNLHDEASLAVIGKAGNQFSFYNGGNRWTYGRYMKMLVKKHNLALRLSWHYNVVAGDPYYALDCREDDYCWFNTDAEGQLAPSASFLGSILPGLNDYRYLTTLERLLTEKPQHPAAAQARKVYDEMLDLEAGKDRDVNPMNVCDKDRARVIEAIESLLK